MPGLAETIARLSQLRTAAASPGTGGGALTELTDFGSNPGALRGWMHVPEAPDRAQALVVVLHGCTQTAQGYDTGSGWSRLADRYGFALLFAEQQRRNNPNLCFNWFSPEDNARDRGEALSIRQMIGAALSRHRLDPARLFVTGLSAGGAMAGVMLATYPELFAGGAIIAGLPYGSASGVPQALDRMRGQGVPGEAALAALVRGASPHRGPWPILSVWHGSGDATVAPSNADAIVNQWRMLHGLGPAPSRSDVVNGHPRRVWSDASSREVIEEFRIAGMGHGTPLDTQGEGGCGTAGAFMLQAGISSGEHICRFWGLAGADPASVTPAEPAARALMPTSIAHREARREPKRAQAERITPPVATGVGKVIEDALRSAGLMR